MIYHTHEFPTMDAALAYCAAFEADYAGPGNPHEGATSAWLNDRGTVTVHTERWRSCD